MTITLPTERVPAVSRSPKRLFLYSAPKVGKTTAVSMLDNCLLLDFEDGSDFVDAMRLPVKDLKNLKEILAAVNEAGNPYKYGAVDTVTTLEEMVIPLANELYKKTQMGKNFDPADGDVLTLPKGSGYLYLRKAYFKVINAINAAFERVIYLGHLKDISLSKDGKEISIKDIDLTGKLKNMSCASSDAIGFMYRKDNETIVSFQSGLDLVSGARPLHLKNREIVLLSSDESGNLTHGWDKIYID